MLCLFDGLTGSAESTQPNAQSSQLKAEEAGMESQKACSSLATSDLVDLWRVVEERCGKHEQAVAYATGNGDGAVEVTYGEVLRRVKGLSAEFLSLFPGESSAFGVLLPNCHYHVDLFFAAAATRRKMVCLNHRLALEELQVLLDRGNFGVLVASSSFSKLLADVCFGATGIRTVVWVGGQPGEVIDDDSIAQVFHENQFQIFEVAELLASGGVTIVKLMPTILKYLVSTEQKSDARFSKLKWVLTGGMKPTPEIIQETQATLGCDFLQGYGMTENTCHVAFKNESKEPFEGGLTVVPGLELKIFDENDQEVGPGIVGEISVRGPTLFDGYEADGEIAAAGFTEGGPLGGGFFKSGDLGHLDSHGKLFISGRSKDMIIVGGENVFAVEVERVISKLAGVMRVAVFGAPDEALGEVVRCAVVVLPEGPLVDESDDAVEAQIIRLCKGSLAPFKVPLQCHVWQEQDFPMTGSGKPLKHEIRAACLAAAHGQRDRIGSGCLTKEAAVLGVLAAVLDRKLSEGDLDTPFVELGMASMEFTRVVNMLSELLHGGVLSPTLLFDNETPRALIDHLNAHEDLNLQTPEEVVKRVTTKILVPDWDDNSWRSTSPCSLLLQVLLLLVRPLVLTPPVLFAACGGYTLAVWSERSLRDGMYGEAIAAMALAPMLYPASLLVLMLLACIAKYLLVGCVVEGMRPLWGPSYCLWLCSYNLFQSLDPLLALLRGTPVLIAFYRMCGASIDFSAELHTSNLTDCDLVEIGPGAIVDRACNVQPSHLAASRGGYVVLGRITIGAGCRVGYGACLRPHTVLPPGAKVRPLQAPTSATGSAEGRDSGSSGSSAMEGVAAFYVVGAVVALAVALGGALLGELDHQLELGADPLATLLPRALSRAWGLGKEQQEAREAKHYVYWALLPFVVFFIVPQSYFLCVVILKRLVIGRRRPGQLSQETKWRRWVSWLYICLIDCPLFRLATQLFIMSHLTILQYRLLGVKIGRRAYFCAPFVPDPELVDIGDNVICAGNVALLTSSPCAGHSAAVCLRDFAIVANTVVLMPGAVVGSGSVVGDGVAVLEEQRLADRVLAMRDNAGNMPYILVNRPKEESFPPQASERLYLCCQCLLVTLQMLLNVVMHVPGYVCIGLLMTASQHVWTGPPREECGTWPLLPMALLIAMVSKIMLIVVAKWCIACRFRAIEVQLFGVRYAVWIALEAALFDGDALFLQALCGSAMLATWYWLMGAKIGSDVCLMGSSVGCEYDLKHLGSGAVVNHGSLLFSHSVERGTLIFRTTVLGAASELGVNCVAEAGAVVGEAGCARHGQVVHNARAADDVGQAVGLTLSRSESQLGFGDDSMPRRVVESGGSLKDDIKLSRRRGTLVKGYSEAAAPSRQDTQALDSILNLDDFERAAEKVLPKPCFEYYRGGAADEWTLSQNIAAFGKYSIIPRVLVPVKKLDMESNLWGARLRFPILVAPSAMHLQAHIDAEVATAKAAVRMGSAMVLSSLSNCSLQDVAAVVPLDPVTQRPAGLMFQLYVFKRRDITEAIVKKAAELGYKALVLTVDAPITGRRECDIRNGFSTSDSMGQLPIIQMLGGSPNSQLLEFEAQKDLTLDWSIIAWLKTICDLPVIAKGIMHPRDATLAVEAGASGIVVSNHGGRQLDAVPATIDVLADVVKAVEGRVPVLMDGGVRRGTDVFKAMALGADAVLLGRPVVYALAAGGEAGVARMLRLIQEEFQATMRLAGCASLAEIPGRLHNQRLRL